jgi:hypothetical protein
MLERSRDLEIERSGKGGEEIDLDLDFAKEDLASA